MTRSGAERSPALFGWLRKAARLTMLPARLGRGARERMEAWAKERKFEFGRPEPREGWSPPELLPPPDEEIMAARQAVERHRQATLARQKQEEKKKELRRERDAGRKEKEQAGQELENLSSLKWRRRGKLEAEIEAATKREEAAEAELEALEPVKVPEQPDEETRRLQSMPTGAKRLREAEAQRRGAARQAVERMKKDGLFLERQRDPAHENRWEHPPERSLLFVVASPAHAPDESSYARLWHHIAVWDPSSGPEGLEALRMLHPDADMAPAAELRAEWPKGVPALDPDKADHEVWNCGLARHIDAVEGRVAEPKPEPDPDPKPRNDGPSFG